MTDIDGENQTEHRERPKHPYGEAPQEWQVTLAMVLFMSVVAVVAYALFSGAVS